MLCKERDRLNRAYIDALAEHLRASESVPEMGSEAWKAATHETRKRVQAAREELNKHKLEHECVRHP